MFGNPGDTHACFSDSDNAVGRRFKSRGRKALLAYEILLDF